MNEVERIADQLKRAFEGKAWHGPSVLEVIDGVTAQQACSRPIHGAHSIWELVLHIESWERVVLRRLQGERAEPPNEEDWRRVICTSEEAWKDAVEGLKHGHDNLRRTIANLDQARLDQPILEGMSSVYGTLQGIVQHDIYHAGQIAILKKATLEGAGNERTSK